MNLIDPDDILPSNVVAINDDASKHLEILRAEKQEESMLVRCYGLHKQVEVDGITRTIKCMKCGRTLDPFDYLEQWAKEGDRRMTGLKGLDIQLRVRNAELRDLERKVGNLRSALKRLGGKNQDEHRAFESALCNMTYNPAHAEAEKFLSGKEAS